MSIASRIERLQILSLRGETCPHCKGTETCWLLHRGVTSGIEAKRPCDAPACCQKTSTAFGVM